MSSEGVLGCKRRNRTDQIRDGHRAIVLSAVSAWSSAVDKLSIRKQLDSLHRGFAQEICKAYRTVSLTSTLVRSDQLPLVFWIREAAMLHKTKKGHCVDRSVEDSWSAEYEPPLPMQNLHSSVLITTEYERLESMNPQILEEHHIDGPLIYTDGSKRAKLELP
ncbi:unnamed protein product [Euphydryas editha]|uniref:Uncharacterized protein n=1 Tax=Euphydryas editha TaxID=104508 RepID=A0AAU9TJ11_EUPED|nr:unnamed protein product [Euphydryas editha]